LAAPCGRRSSEICNPVSIHWGCTWFFSIFGGAHLDGKPCSSEVSINARPPHEPASSPLQNFVAYATKVRWARFMALRRHWQTAVAFHEPPARSRRREEAVSLGIQRPPPRHPGGYRVQGFNARIVSSGNSDARHLPRGESPRPAKSRDWFPCTGKRHRSGFEFRVYAARTA
jgi:hypothetical protein